ncbi:MAG: type I restriction-modification system subunit M [Oscillatoriales cyanobacterium]|nr:MAG: type I restriction-modification system subunit M [Oscillatoriales cyanobacterium]TAH19751.1 MAG: type I restriction-modification system subunit M [Oscillatoriales cyanobacterium]
MTNGQNGQNGQKKKLETQLWNIADSLRGKMNADEFRDYCLGFIFYKYLSERQYLYANAILAEDGIDFLELDESSAEGQEYLEAIKEESIAQLGYFLKPSELFGALAKRALGNKAEEEEISDEELEASSIFILDDLTQVLNSIERSTMGKESEEDFDHLFEDLDLTSTKLGRTPKAKNALIAKILVHLNKIDFRLDDSESDVLGDAYEYLIGQFASGAGKKAGEFYTPQQVSKVLAKIVTTGKTRLKSVYDPTCGSGSLLLRVAREVDEVGDFYGQEMNRTTYNLARMNMILHGVHYRNFDLRQEDTLEHPQHEGMRFEAVVANPPFSSHWSANKLFESDDRFSQYGRLAPSSKADFAFVQHMLHHLDDSGTMAVVLPHGVLFRGAAEGHIRRYLIEERNWLDAVIGLPANIFYGTSIPTCILVLKKCREHPEDILFVDASAHFEKAKNQNFLRDEDVDKIVATYRDRLQEDKYSYCAPLSEVAENDFNLNIPRYVDTFEEEEEIDLQIVTQSLTQFQKNMESADREIRRFCDELDLPFPNGCNLHLLQTYKRGVMQKLFSQQIRFKCDDGHPFPDWEKKKLGQLLTIRYGKDHKDLEDGNYPVLGTGGIMRYVNSYLYDKPSILIGRKGTIDKPQFVTYPFWTVDTLFYSEISPDLIPYFLFLVVQSINWQKYNEATGVPSLNTSSINNVKVIIPPDKKEQEKIADFLTAIDKKLEAVAKQINLTEQFKKGLLQKMFV